MVATAALFAPTAPWASGSVIFSQTPANNSISTVSDRGSGATGEQDADNFTLTSPNTARSVTWRGAYFGPNTPSLPLSFDLIFYGNAGSVPDHNNVLSSTTVAFPSNSSFTDTGIDVFGADVYQFRASLTPTALPGGTQVWFSVLADTSNNPNDNFFWTTAGDGSDAAAHRDNVAGNAAFNALNQGPFYFVLDNAALPGGGVTGDYNASGQVEQGDLDQVLSNWGVGFAAIPSGWLSQRPTSGIVDQAELDVVLTNWGSSGAPDFAGSNLPEPASLALLGIAGALLGRRR